MRTPPPDDMRSSWRWSPVGAAGRVATLLILLFGWGQGSPAAAAREVLADGVLSYGGDAEGGAPNTFYDPRNPARLVGFEVDIAVEIARRLGVKAEFRQNAWESLIPALDRGDCDIVINGIEVTPDRAAVADFTRPYYVFQQQLTVRKDETEISSAADLTGPRVGTLNGSLARQMLADIAGVEIVTYSGVVEPYEDLAAGRIDAVLLDLPIAAYYARPNPRLRDAGPPLGEGLYAVAVRPGEHDLFDAVDQALADMVVDGTLRQILSRWDLWNSRQSLLAEGRALTERFSRAAIQEAEPPHGTEDSRPRAEVTPQSGSRTHEVASPTNESGSPRRPERPWARYLPQLLAGAGMTLALSITSMAVAVILGLALALGRLYGSPLGQKLITGYIEVIRGTPLLVQLFLLYYGLPNVGVRLSALEAAILGLGLNYAAYEAEIYRAGILSIPRGQSEAALSLGMTQVQALRHVLLPQALRVVLPPVTNDFIGHPAGRCFLPTMLLRRRAPRIVYGRF